eukprot:gnl/MRDRNA2_/MRDRNA2_30969_c0_seq1.p1 gnl/MRDRNA2_/MRDRNA2_30969_c0~~gnl/MRDRNA2_/MRDRNA2_30969_c0_seq1.p1  ORF type:complete len:2431 (+),score=758.19 gnl/MRDRNA2_/MRDRNA2_30969_c0_seq1:136-7293(+)
MPVAKLLEFGIPFVPIWIPFWLGLVPSDWLVPKAVQEKFAKQCPHSASHARYLAIFEEATRAVEDLQEQKICISINASKFAKKIPPSSASLQKTIVYYNRQIESYHRQIQDEKAPKFGRYMFLEGDGQKSQKNRPSMDPAPRLTGIAESPMRTRQLESQLTAARIESDRLLQECSVETRAAADAFNMVDRLRSESAAERGIREASESQSVGSRQQAVEKRLQAELVEASARIQGLEAQLMNMQVKVNEVSDLRQQLGQKDRRNDAEKEDLQMQLARMEERYEVASKDKLTVMDELASTRAALEKLRASRSKADVSPAPPPRRVAAAFGSMSPGPDSTSSPKQNDALKEENRKLREEMKELQQEQRRTAFEVAQTREKAADKERDLHETRQTLSKKNSVVSALSTEKSASDEKQKNLQIEARQVREEVDEIREAAEHSAAKEVLEEMYVRESVLLEEVARAQASSKEMQDALEARQAELTAECVQARTEITSLKWAEGALASDLDTSRRSYNVQQEDLAARMAQLEEIVSQRQAEQRELSSVLDEERNAAELEHRALLRVQMEREEARMAVEKLRIERDDIIKTMDGEAHQRVAEVARREELRAEICVLEECSDRLRNDLNGRDTELQTNRRCLAEIESDLARSRLQAEEGDSQACELLAEVGRLETVVAGGRDQYGELERTLSLRDADLVAAESALSKACQAHEVVERQREAEAGRFEVISAEVKRLQDEFQVNCSKHELLQEKLNHECTAAATLQRALDNERTVAKEDALLQTKKIAEEAAAHDEQRREAAALRSALRATEADTGELENDLGKLTMQQQLERSKFEEKIERLESELARRLKQATDSDAQSCELMAEIGRLETAVAGGREQYDGLVTTLNCRDADLMEERSALASARAAFEVEERHKQNEVERMQALLAECDGLQKELRSGGDAHEALSQRLFQEQKAAEALQHVLDDERLIAKEDVAQQAEKLESEAAAADDARRELAALRTTLMAKESGSNELERTLSQLQIQSMAERTELKQKIVSLEQHGLEAQDRAEQHAVRLVTLEALIEEQKLEESSLNSQLGTLDKTRLLQAMKNAELQEEMEAKERAQLLEVKALEEARRKTSELEAREAANLFALRKEQAQLEEELNAKLNNKTVELKKQEAKSLEENRKSVTNLLLEEHQEQSSLLRHQLDDEVQAKIREKTAEFQRLEARSLEEELAVKISEVTADFKRQEAISLEQSRRDVTNMLVEEHREQCAVLRRQLDSDLNEKVREKLAQFKIQEATMFEHELNARIKEKAAEFRKQEARTLEESRRNVTNMLLEEHRTQCSSLKRQLDDGAVASGTLRAELGDARRETEHLRNAAGELEGQAAAAEKARITEEAAVADVRSELCTLRSALMASQTSSGDLECTLRKIEMQSAAQRGDLERTVLELEKRCLEDKKSLEDKLQRAKEDADRRADRLDELEKRESSLQDALLSRDEELSDLETALGDSNATRNDLVSQVEKLRADHDNVTSDIRDQREQLVQQELEVQRLTRQMKQSEATANAALEQNAGLEDALSSTSGALEKKGLRIREVEKELVILEAQLEEGLSCRLELEKVVSREEQALAAKEAKVADLEEKLRRAESKQVETTDVLQDRLHSTTNTVDELERTCASQKVKLIGYEEELKGKATEIAELQKHTNQLTKLADAASDSAMVDESRAKTLECALERSVAERHCLEAKWNAKLQQKVHNSEKLEQNLESQVTEFAAEEATARRFALEVQELLSKSKDHSKEEVRLYDAISFSEGQNAKLVTEFRSAETEVRCMEAEQHAVADALKQQLKDSMDRSHRDVSELKAQLAGKSQEQLMQLTKESLEKQQKQQKEQVLEGEVLRLESQIAQLQLGEIERAEQHLDRFAALEDELDRRERQTMQLRECLGTVEETAQQQSKETLRLHNEVCTEMLMQAKHSAEASENKFLIESLERKGKEREMQLQDAKARLKELEMKCTTGYVHRTELEKVLKAKDAHVDDLSFRLARMEGESRLTTSAYSIEANGLQKEILDNQAQCNQLESCVAAELARIEEKLNLDIEDRDVAVRNEVARAEVEAQVAQTCENQVVNLERRLREKQALTAEMEGKLAICNQQIELQNCEILAMRCERQADTEVTGHIDESLGSLRGALREVHSRALTWEASCAEEQNAGMLQKEHLAASQLECAARTAECAGLEQRLELVSETAEHEWTKAMLLQKQLQSECEIYTAHIEKLQLNASAKLNSNVDFGMISRLEEHAALQASATHVARQQIACLEEELDLKEKEIVRLEQERQGFRLARASSPLRDCSLKSIDRVKADRSGRESLLQHQLSEKEQQLQVKDEHIARLLNVLKEHRMILFEDESTGTCVGDVSSRSSMQSGG